MTFRRTRSRVISAVATPALLLAVGACGATAAPAASPTAEAPLWSQEGERIVPPAGATPTLIDPTVRFAQRDGRFSSELTVPPSTGRTPASAASGRTRARKA